MSIKYWTCLITAGLFVASYIALLVWMAFVVGGGM